MNDVYGFCGLMIVMTFVLTSMFVWACAALTGERIERLEKRVAALEALLEPTDVDDDSEVELTAVTVSDLEQWHGPRMECEP
jgi:hypothetical protein